MGGERDFCKKKIPWRVKGLSRTYEGLKRVVGSGIVTSTIRFVPYL